MQVGLHKNLPFYSTFSIAAARSLGLDVGRLYDYILF